MSSDNENEEPLKDLELETNKAAEDSSAGKPKKRRPKHAKKWLKKGGKSKKNPLEVDNLPALGENASSRYSQCMRKLRDNSRHHVELGKAMIEIREDGLWRAKDFSDFQDWYSEHGYTADEVCNLIASSRLLEALIEDHGPWVKVSHAMVLLRGRASGESRHEADIEPLREIYSSVVNAAEGRVTIKAIKEALIGRDLITPSAPKPPESKQGDSKDESESSEDSVDLGPDSDEPKSETPKQEFQPPEELQRARLLAMKLATESVDDPIHDQLEELLALINAALGCA